MLKEKTGEQMKITVLRPLVPDILDFFNDYIYRQFEQSTDGVPDNAEAYKIKPEQVRIIPPAGEKRAACFAEIGMEYYECRKNSSGEAIHSPDKTKFLILIYNKFISDENEFVKVLFHEAGHAVAAISSPEFAKLADPVDTGDEATEMARIGTQVWSECIADSIANRAFEQYMIQKEKQDGVAPGSYVYRNRADTVFPAFGLCDNTFTQNGKIDEYCLGLYIAYLTTDPSLLEWLKNKPEESVGYDQLESDIAHGFVKVLRFCEDKLYALDKENADGTNQNYGAYWKVDVDWLIKLGCLVHSLEEEWLTLFIKRQMARIERFGLAED